jgi:hypothetical protein
MTQQLAAQASAGGAMLLLTVVVMLVALEGAAGGRSLPPTLVAGPLFHHGLAAGPSGRVERDRRRASGMAASSSRCARPLGHIRHRR